MNHIFRPGEAVRVPDGTLVRPALTGSPDVDLSIAAGEILPHTKSNIHLHPCVTRITWVLSGELTVRMKDDSAAEPYTLALCAVYDEAWPALAAAGWPRPDPDAARAARSEHALP